jgi:hypothetical protein
MPKGPIGQTCRCKESKKNGTTAVEASNLAREAIQLQQLGLIGIVCDDSSNCPGGTYCEGGYCKNDTANLE